jgi:hypothetical protein
MHIQVTTSLWFPVPCARLALAWPHVSRGDHRGNVRVTLYHFGIVSGLNKAFFLIEPCPKRGHSQIQWVYRHFLVGGFNQQKICSSVGMMTFPIYGKMFQTTKQSIVYSGF